MKSLEDTLSVHLIFFILLYNAVVLTTVYYCQNMEIDIRSLSRLLPPALYSYITDLIMGNNSSICNAQKYLLVSGDKLLENPGHPLVMSVFLLETMRKNGKNHAGRIYLT